MTDPINHFTQRLCFNVYATHRAFGRFYQAAIGDSGLTYAKFVILNALKDVGPLTISDLSVRAGVEPNTLSPLLKKLAAFEVITRIRDEKDERRVMINLAPKGRELLEQADAVVQEGFAQLGLDYAQCVQSIKFLEEVRQKLDDSNPPKFSVADKYKK